MSVAWKCHGKSLRQGLSLRAGGPFGTLEGRMVDLGSETRENRYEQRARFRIDCRLDDVVVWYDQLKDYGGKALQTGD